MDAPTRSERERVEKKKPFNMRKVTVRWSKEKKIIHGKMTKHGQFQVLKTMNTVQRMRQPDINASNKIL